jgi:UDP-N-acetylmuramoyl-tripeptide--D-alanyl-D-alanine ligase
MKLSLESFLDSTTKPRGVILGEMLELGKFSLNEHKRIVELIEKKEIDEIIFIGNAYKKFTEKIKNSMWFENSNDAQKWFRNQNFKRFKFLLKGSRGVKVENVIE